jgi:dethiobiotin synthetase
LLHKILKTVNIIYGISTDVGKTYITCDIIKKTNLKLKENFAIKPVISGFDESRFEYSDNYQLLKACGVENPTLEQVKSISKYLLFHPLSPDISAKKENIDIDLKKIISFCEYNIAKIKQGSKIFIETAGGVCSPCSKTHTMADISQALSSHSPCNILVTMPYLGSLSHTISALKVLRFDVVIINNKNNEECEEFVWSLKNHLPYGVEIVIFS